MVDRFTNTTGKRIKLHREDLGLRQEDVVRLLMEQGIEIGQSRLSRIEQQQHAPPGEIVAGLAKILNVSTDYLLLLTDDPTQHDDDELPSEVDPDDPLLMKLLQYWDMLGMTDRAILLNLAARLADQNVVAFVGRHNRQLENQE